MSSYPPSNSSNTFNSNDFSSLNTSKSVLSQQQANNLYLKKSGDTASGTMIFSSGTQQRNTDAILFSDDSSSLTTKLNAKQNTITSATNLSVNNLTTSGTLTTNSNINMNGNIIANSQTITPINVSYLSGTTSNIQNQINNKQDILTSSTNISVNNINCSLVVTNTSSNLNFGTNNTIRWYIDTAGNLISNGNYAINSGGLLILNQYASSYQKKALFTASGQITNLPSWTSSTISNLGALGSISFSTFQFDIGNYYKHIIHFQGYFTNIPANNPSLNISGMRNGALDSTIRMDNNILKQSKSTTFTGMDLTTNAQTFVQIFNNMYNTSVVCDFGGVIILNNNYSNGSGGAQFEISGYYCDQTTVASKIHGTARFSQAGSGINGIQFQFNNIPTNGGVTLRYYVECI